jgi:hypothetical protein
MKTKSVLEWSMENLFWSTKYLSMKKRIENKLFENYI